MNTAEPADVESEQDDTPSEAPASTPTVERWLPLAVGLAVALPTLLAFYLPMTDLGMHEGALGVMRHLGDARYFPPGLYSLNLGHSNQLFYFLAWPLSYVVTTAWACKLVIAGTQVAIFTGAGRLADHVGRSRWSVLLFAPLALGFTYYWGLVTNLLGFAVFFYALPPIDRFVTAPTKRNFGAVCAALVLLYFAHESVFTMAIVTLLLFTALRAGSPRQLAVRLLPAGVALGLVAFNHLRAEQIKTKAVPLFGSAYMPLLKKLALFSNALFGSHEPLIRHLLLAVGLMYFAALVASRRQEEASTGEDEAEPREATKLARMRAFALRYRFELLGFGMLLGFFVVPYNFRGATMLHERFLGPAWGVLAVCAAPRVHVLRAAKLLGLVLPAGVLLVGWPQFADASATSRDLAAIIDQIPKGHAVGLCSLNKAGYGFRIYSGGTLAARALAVVGGRTSISLMKSPIAPVQMRPESMWTENEMRMLLYPSRGFKPGHDFQLFDYVIAHSRVPEMREDFPIVFGPEADLVARQGEWLLFRSRLPVIPIDAPEVPAPREMETVMDRINFVLSRRRLPLTPEPPANTDDTSREP